MKTRHDQSPDISEDDYNKFSDPEKKSQKFMKKTKFKKVLLNSNISPTKIQLVIWSDPFCEIFIDKKEIYQNPRVKYTLELYTQ